MRVDPDVIRGDQLGEVAVEVQDEVDEPGDQLHERDALKTPRAAV